MLGIASRSVLRSQIPRHIARTISRRTISTAPPDAKSRSFRSVAARWAVALGGVYYYNTSPVFAEEPAFAIAPLPTTSTESEQLPTLDSIATARKQRREAALAATPAADASSPTSGGLAMSAPKTSTSAASSSSAIAANPATAGDAVAPVAGSPEELEEEAEGEGAFNPETGEINWDCPCLGGMAHGPCGPQFREAFSCFVYSKEEPKGVDCIDRFKSMQDCFRAHPDVYGAELSDDTEDLDDELALDAPAPSREPAAAPYSGAKTAEAAVPDHNLTASPSASQVSLGEGTKASTSTSTPKTQASRTKGEKIVDTKPRKMGKADKAEADAKTERALAAQEQVQDGHGEPTSESAEVVPKAWHDAK